VERARGSDALIRGLDRPETPDGPYLRVDDIGAAAAAAVEGGAGVHPGLWQV
jgi:hypothetical protein